MTHKINIFRKKTLLLLGFITASILVSCDPSLFRDDLPDSNSKPDTVLPSSDFTYTPDADDFKTIDFTDLSSEAIAYQWDFGGGATSTDQDPSYTFSAGEGTYPVTLTVSDGNGVSDTKTMNVIVIDLFVPINPSIENGDMEDSSNGWKTTFPVSGMSGNGFESSSDGSWLNYAGENTGAKTRGAKWNKKRSAAEFSSSDTRHAYQSIVVSPNWEYTLEFEYAIKDDVISAPDVEPIGGRRIVAEILDGHFDDGDQAQTHSLSGGALVTHVGTEVKGKTTFTTVKVDFTSNDSGEVAIWLWAVTPVDCYIDNVKVTPKPNN